tara:strand:- start:281 stop:478 length:198 start_codon:yes stop_codon:yes gene_type:complete
MDKDTLSIEVVAGNTDTKNNYSDLTFEVYLRAKPEDVQNFMESHYVDSLKEIHIDDLNKLIKKRI